MEKRPSLLTVNVPVLKIDGHSLPRLSKKSTTTTDEKKNLSKHHLVLPNNTQICVETLLSFHQKEQSKCKVASEQRNRKLRPKKEAKKKKVALLKPKNFILKNERLRPIVTTNVKSGVFRSVCSVDQKKRNCVAVVPSNVLYSRSTLSSRIQTVNDFCNDKWIVERVTQYMPNDWTKPVTLNGTACQDRQQLIAAADTKEKLKAKDPLNRNETKMIRPRLENENVEQIRKPTIHRLVTPEGFQLSTKLQTVPRPGQSYFAPNKDFKQPHIQPPLHNNEHKPMEPTDTTTDSLEVIPVSVTRTRFSRALRSPIKCGADIDAIPVLDVRQNIIHEDAASKRLTEPKSSFGDKNRCRTCKKVYLGRRKVMRHLKAFPDHDIPIPSNKRLKPLESKSRLPTPIPPVPQHSDRLFDVLIQKIKNAPVDEKSHILFREISDFVEKLEAIRSQLLCDDNTHSAVEYLDKHCSKIFGTQEGNYHISLDILDQLAAGIDPNEFANHSATDANILPNQIDHNINVSLSSISESKIHLVEGISEESLLKTVDDLMRKEGRMSDGNFDHIEISDNAVEATSLKSSCFLDLNL